MEKTKLQSKYDNYISQVDPELLKKWRIEQNILKGNLIEMDQFDFELDSTSFLIAGMDISASKNNPDVAVVALVIFDKKKLNILYEKYDFVTLNQPYIPGYLAFREVEHLNLLLEELKNNKPELLPNVILIDGNGILHSNRFGLACHLGVLSGIPTIGCSKTVFSVDGINKFSVKNLAINLKKGGEYALLKGESGSIWGAALRCTDESTDPLIVNIGHKVCLDTAIKIVKSCCIYRVPEPIRVADKNSRYIIKEYENKNCIFKIDEFLSLNKI